MMTDRPARHYGLRDRGRVAQNYWADLVVFDPELIGSNATESIRDLPGGGERLSATARGVRRVLVRGRPVVIEGLLTSERPGQVLRSGRDTETVTLAEARQSHSGHRASR